MKLNPAISRSLIARPRSSAMWTITVFAFAYVLCDVGTPTAEGANILAVQTFAGKSHWNFIGGVVRALTDAGHHVTVFTPFPEGDRENYTEIDTSDRFPLRVGMNVADLVNNFASIFTALSVGTRESRNFCDIIFGDDRMTRILEEGKSGGNGGGFDVVLVHRMASDCASRVATALDLPMIYMITSIMPGFMERSLVGQLSHPATVSHIMARHAIPETFWQRLGNVALSVYADLMVGYVEWTDKRARPRSYDTWPPTTASATFLNSHYSTDASRSFPANVIQIGGVHLKPVKDLPKSILEFVENSPHGVIYFTLGSMTAMSTVPEHILKAFKNAFARIPQRVLWKFEGEMKDKPENVMVSKWFPQRDVLAHPKIKLYISHGGISGVYEAVDAGVPVLGLPLFYDQPKNIEHLVHIGMAISMDLQTLTADTFLKNVLELVNNKKYTENAKIASEQFRDRPVSPAESIVYWTEHVIRHGGASNLKSNALNLKWYQILMLDVTAVILATGFILSYTLYKMSRYLV